MESKITTIFKIGAVFSVVDSDLWTWTSDGIVEQEAIEMEKTKRIQKAFCIVVIRIIFIFSRLC